MAESGTVQRVDKASSDQLLRKFADTKPDPPPKRAKRSCRPVPDVSSKYSGVLVERNSLLSSSHCRTETFGRLKTKKPADLRVRDRMRNRVLVTLVKKTWRRTMDRASKLLLDKYRNPHVRLINEIP